MARHSKDPRNQVIGVFKAGSTINDIAHLFGCSRQANYDLMNQYNSTASVRVRARPGRARVATLRPYHVTRLFTKVIISTSGRYCLAFMGFMHKRSLISSYKITDLAFSSMSLQGFTQRVNNHTIPYTK